MAGLARAPTPLFYFTRWYIIIEIITKFHTMQQSHYKKGFAPLIILLIVVVLGGGSFYAYKKLSVKGPTNADKNNEMNAKVSGEVGTGSILALATLGKDLSCTFTDVESSSNSSGTLFVSGTSMRVDFVTKTGTGAMIESHLVRSGDMMYTWTGAGETAIKTKVVANAMSDSNTKKSDVDMKVQYTCVAWSKDASKFEVPANINFLDISSMMQGQGDTFGSTNGNVQSTTSVNVKATPTSGTKTCAMCDMISAGPNRVQCEQRMGCR